MNVTGGPLTNTSAISASDIEMGTLPGAMQGWGGATIIGGVMASNGTMDNGSGAATASKQ